MKVDGRRTTDDGQKKIEKIQIETTKDDGRPTKEKKRKKIGKKNMNVDRRRTTDDVQKNIAKIQIERDIFVVTQKRKK